MLSPSPPFTPAVRLPSRRERLAAAIAASIIRGRPRDVFHLPTLVAGPWAEAVWRLAERVGQADPAKEGDHEQQ